MNEKPIWQSKKLIMSLVGVVAGWLANYLDMNPLEITTVLAPVAAYVLGQGLADLGKNKVPLGERPAEKEFWKSKKFIASLIGIVVALLQNKAGFELSEEIVGLISVYITGQGLADTGKNAGVIS